LGRGFDAGRSKQSGSRNRQDLFQLARAQVLLIEPGADFQNVVTRGQIGRHQEGRFRGRAAGDFLHPNHLGSVEQASAVVGRYQEDALFRVFEVEAQQVPIDPGDMTRRQLCVGRVFEKVLQIVTGLTR